MDPIEKQAGVSEDNFWHRAKLGLIGALLTKAGARGKDILVIGCGTGNDLKVIRGYANRLIVCDINKEALKSITGKAVKICADATALPLETGTVDVVLSLDVFEHIPDDGKAIGECRRVLRKRGKLIFTAPAWSSLYSGFDSQVQHVRRYNRAELEKKLVSFRKVYLSYWNFLLFPAFAAERLIRKQTEKRAGKQGIGKQGLKASDMDDAARLPKPLNVLLYGILSIDAWLIRKGARLPWGLSLCGIYQKR